MTNFKTQMSNQVQMTKYQKFLISGFWILFVIWILSFGFSNASAQQAPEFILTWKAANYAPSGYQGRVFPTSDTKVDAALELIDGGKLANLSGAEIRWYVNNNLQKSGAGLKTFTFNADGTRGDQTLRVSINDYRGLTLEKTITIPLASPELVIDGGPNAFRALPYFFNFGDVRKANFTWSANGAEVAGDPNNPDVLFLDTRNLAPGTEIVLEASINNVFRALETAVESIRFYLPQ